jgi:hypothetical protein
MNKGESRERCRRRFSGIGFGQNTLWGEGKRAWGGRRSIFLIRPVFFPMKLVGVVGRDFPTPHLDLLRRRKINLDGLQVADGETFRWSGFYEYDLNEAKTLDTRLNVFEKFSPNLPESYRNADCVFPGQHRPRSSNPCPSSGAPTETHRRGHHEFVDLHQKGEFKGPVPRNRHSGSE